jgi:hypothetical protein
MCMPRCVAQDSAASRSTGRGRNVIVDARNRFRLVKSSRSRQIFDGADELPSFVFSFNSETPAGGHLVRYFSERARRLPR